MEKKSPVLERHQAIQELVTSYAITDQADLVELLKKRYAIETNQAVISRDLRTLGICKRMRNGEMVYELPNVDAIEEVLNYAVQAVECNETMIIIKTLPGTAGFVAEFLDLQHEFAIAGTIAGENTVFVAPKSIKSIGLLVKKLRQKFKIKE